MTQKPQRWYTKDEDGTVRVYDHWEPERASFVSIVTTADLPFYRHNFQLRKVTA